METVFVSEYSYQRGRRVYDGLNAEGGDVRFVAVEDEEAALAGRIREEGVRAFIASGAVFSGALYEALGEGGVIVRFGVGHEGVDKGKARECGVLVANTPGCLENAVAEHGLWLLGCLARSLAGQMRGCAEGKWEPREGVELGGRKLAVVGFGRIGRKLGKLAKAVGMEVTGVGRRPAGEAEECDFAEYTNDLGAALREADFVAVVAAATEETYHLVDEGFLNSMKASAFLLNLARGALVNEGDLYDALKAGRIAGAGLDVFEEEPYVPGDEGKDLRTLANVIMTPHTASDTVEANDAMARMTVETVRGALSGRGGELGNLVS